MTTRLALGSALLGVIAWFLLATRDPAADDPAPDVTSPLDASRGDRSEGSGGATAAANATRRDAQEGTGPAERATESARAREAAATTSWITVRVVDRSGRAVGGALLDVWRSDRSLALATTGSAPGPADRTAVTDAAGIAECRDLPRTFLIRPRAPGWLALEVLHGARAPRGGDLGEHVLSVAEASSLAVSVVDEADHPVPGAEIAIAPSGAAQRSHPTEVAGLEVHAVRALPPRQVAEGTTVFERPAGDPVDVQVNAAGFQGAHRGVGGDEHAVRIVLKRLGPDERALRGRVEDVLGRAIPGAEVVFEGTAVRVLTDDDGRFRIDAPPLLDPLRIAAAGYRVGMFRFEPRWLAEEVAFVLHEGAALAGWVVDGEGRPLSALRVEARGASSASGSDATVEATTTGADGRFRFEGVRPGAHVLRAVRDGGTLAMRTAHAPDDAVRLVAGSVEPAVVSVRGRIVDGVDGTPLASVRVQVQASTGGTGLLWETLAAVTTDAAGRWAIDDVPWRAVMIDAEKPGWVAERVPPRLLALGENAFDLALFAERELSVLVVDAAGEPAAGVAVFAYDAEGRAVDLRTGPGSFALWIHTGPSGTAHLRGLPARRVHLHASSQHAAATEPATVELATVPTEPIVLRLATAHRRLVRSVRFVPRSPPAPDFRGEIVLRILDDDGVAVARVRLLYDDEGFALQGHQRMRLARGFTVQVPDGPFTVVREGDAWRFAVDAEAERVELDFAGR